MNAQAQKSGKKPATAITPTRDEDFPAWYQNVIKAADMAENAPVRGCMVIKPYGYALWENIQRQFDDIIKDLGVQNAYFPLLIPLEFFSREAEHVDGFAKECAVVTHHRLEAGEDGGLVPAAPLEEPLVVRPTSETIIGDSMARWVQSYRDLPLKLNQWCNVMRWEMRTRLFLRTSEFLWQEGHNAFETPEEAREDALKMIRAYADFAENHLAIPVVTGEKTAEERFPGAIATFSMEAMMQDGKALQAGTSHDLGQNFAQSCGIRFQGRDGKETLACTTSWGISTRLIGAMIMTHGDDDGMMMPPVVAPVQVRILPVMKGEDDAPVLEYCRTLHARLKASDVRADIDDSDARVPDKMWGAIKKGIPVRVEIGRREMDEGTLTHVRRDLGRESKKSCTIDEFIQAVPGILEDIQKNMLARARRFREDATQDVVSVEDIQSIYAAGGTGFVRADTALLDDPGWADIRDKYSLTARVMPFADGGKKVIIGRAY